MTLDWRACAGLVPAMVVTAIVMGGCSSAPGHPPAGAGGIGGGAGVGGNPGVGGSASGAGGAAQGGATGGLGASGGQDGGADARDGSLVDGSAADTHSGAGGGGQAGASGAGGSGGGASCAGRAISFAANVAANNDPAMARAVIDFGTSPDLPIGNARRTIEFWAFVPASSWVGDANTMFFYGTNNRRADGFGLDFGATPATIDPFTNNFFDNDNQPSGVSATVDQWIHFAMTWDGTAVRAFVNGVERATKTSTGAQTTLMTNQTPLIVGGYPPAFFNGQIDELRVWNIARTAADITSTMHRTLAGNEAGLTGYWKFDETSGTSTADAVLGAGHVAHPGALLASSAANLPTFVVSGAPLNCP